MSIAKKSNPITSEGHPKFENEVTKYTSAMKCEFDSDY